MENGEKKDVKTEETEVKTEVDKEIKTDEIFQAKTEVKSEVKEVKTPAGDPPEVVESTEMNAEQFERYNDILRKVSKTAKTSLQTRYNAFEDSEVKSAVKAKILAGETPDIKEISTAVVERHKPPQTDKSAEVQELKAELALIKAGIKPERIDAAKKLFMADGGEVDKFVEKYPEWKTQSGVEFTKAPAVDGKTAPSDTKPPAMNDFERKVYEARKARGLPV